jgi:polyisoprenoid-binding protein YceI
MQTVPALAAAALLAAPALAGATTWDIDAAHTSAGFSVKHMMVSTVRGAFGKTTGALELDEKDVTKSTVSAVIDVSTINTREDKRDAHLKSPDFFDVAKYPNMTFKSKKVAKAGEGKLKVTGDLTIKDVTKEVVLDVELASTESKDPYGFIRRGGTATTKINREDFGLKWNAVLETGGVAVSKEVSITIDIELTKKVDAKKT